MKAGLSCGHYLLGSRDLTAPLNLPPHHRALLLLPGHHLNTMLPFSPYHRRAAYCSSGPAVESSKVLCAPAVGWVLRQAHGPW